MHDTYLIFLPHPICLFPYFRLFAPKLSITRSPSSSCRCVDGNQFQCQRFDTGSNVARKTDGNKCFHFFFFVCFVWFCFFTLTSIFSILLTLCSFPRVRVCRLKNQSSDISENKSQRNPSLGQRVKINATLP